EVIYVFAKKSREREPARPLARWRQRETAGRSVAETSHARCRRFIGIAGGAGNADLFLSDRPISRRSDLLVRPSDRADRHPLLCRVAWLTLVADVHPPCTYRRRG